MGRWRVGALLVALLGACAASVPSDPPKVITVGDSLTWSYQDDVAARVPNVVGLGVRFSGLLDADVCRGQRARAVARLDPDVVVVEYVGNYGGAPYYGQTRAKCAPEVTRPSEGFYKRWALEARRFTRILERRGVRVIWVEAPSSTRVPYDQTIPRLNAIYRGLGETVRALPGMQDADGLHLNPEGQARLAQQVAAKL